MQWRPLILLMTGLTVIYITNLLQQIPYPHPKKLSIPPLDPNLSQYDEVLITTVGSFVYLTTIEFEHVNEYSQVLGISPLKIGVNGKVRQLRKEVGSLLTNEMEDWTLCFEHTLKGHVSKVSTRKGKPEENKTHFAVLYHVVEDDLSMHYARVYYTADSSFQYKDIRLPGSTWIHALSLEKNSLLFTRSPDRYQARMITLPDFWDSQLESNEMIYNQSEYGKQVQKWHQPALSENHDYALAQLYSSNDDIYRIFLFGIEKAANELFITITITDNATSTEGGWTERERGASNYTIYENDPIDYSGYDDMSNYYPEPVDKDYMPQLGISKWALSADSKTIVLPYIKNKLLTLDYTDRIDILQQIEKERKHLYTNSTGYLNEYYYWQDAELTYADISGVQLDEEGDRLAVWTEYNDVYLYDRYANTTVITKPSLSEMVNHWLESYMTNTTETEEELIQKYLPSKWKLSMVITEGGIIPIAYAHFFHDMISHGNYLFIALKNGQVYAYHMDQLEQPKIVNFKTLLFEKWDMLMAMSMIIFIFVYNEYSIFTY